jgi:uncharacterized membrane protein
MLEQQTIKGGTQMESKAKLFGHAIHPIMIVYPLGLLSTAVIFDLIYLATGNQTWTTVSFWMIAAGIIGGLVAAIFGLIDYLNIPYNTRARRIGLLHGLVNVATLVLFVLSWLLRRNLPEAPTTVAFALSFVGVATALLGGWFGGELVERLGLSVSPDAGLNAPNSMTAAETSDRTRLGEKRMGHAN